MWSWRNQLAIKEHSYKSTRLPPFSGWLKGHDHNGIKQRSGGSTGPDLLMLSVKKFYMSQSLNKVTLSLSHLLSICVNVRHPH